MYAPALNLQFQDTMAAAPTFQLLGARLRVASLSSARDFYVGVLGLEPMDSMPGELRLRVPEAAAPILVLNEFPGIPAAPEDAPGLFHLAFLVPGRPGLAAVLRRLAEARWPIAGMSDHGVSEAIYLADPDGNGLEIYADRPRAAWPRRGDQLDMYTRRMDLPGVLASDPDSRAGGLPAGTRLGHVHVRVSDLVQAERFYAGELGLDVTVRTYPGALFFAADGYHHHIGANTWGVRAGARAGPSAGLAGVQAAVAGLPAARTVRDSDGTRFELMPA
jgi:catechol 2,3-dioxygenase